jgi:hypothetical protein
MSSKQMNSFAALCDSDSDNDEVVVESVVESVAVAPTYDTMTSEERVAAAIARVRSIPIPVLPPGGVDLLAMFPDLARMHYAMRNGISWYDMFLYDEELDEFRKRCDERVARGEPRYLSGPARPVSPDHVIECDDWTDVRRPVQKKGGSGGSGRYTTRDRKPARRIETPEEREERRQATWGW